MFKLKGFPTLVIGEEVDTPDVGELLTQPFFFDNSADDVYKYGSEFQKMLLDSIPNLGKNGKRHISVLSEVRLLAPNYRSCTGVPKEPKYEWHIDNEEDEDGIKVWSQDRDIVHLFTNQTTSMTEFFSHPVIITELKETSSYEEMHRYFIENYDSFNIQPKAMPANRMVTFTNHMHRATNPTSYEFKYMFRVVETDRKRAPSEYNPDVNASTVTGENGVTETNILRQGRKITIFIPGFEDTRENVPREQYGKSQPSTVTPVKPSTSPIDFTTIPIHMVGFETELVPNNPTLAKFSPKNSFMLLSKGNFSSEERNQRLLKLYEMVNKSVSLVAPDGTEIFGTIEKDFYDNDPDHGFIAGTHITFHFLEFNKLKPDVEYPIKINKDNGFFYDIPDSMKAVIRLKKLV